MGPYRASYGVRSYVTAMTRDRGSGAENKNADEEEQAMVQHKGLFHHTMDPPYIKDRYEESILVIEAESEE